VVVNRYPVAVPLTHFKNLISALGSVEDITPEWVVNAVRACFGKRPEELTRAERDDLIDGFETCGHTQKGPWRDRFFLLLTPRVPLVGERRPLTITRNSALAAFRAP